MTPKLWDAHVHLDFMTNAAEVSRQAALLDMGLLAVTVTPRDYLRYLPELGNIPNVRFAAGLHPWWIADGRCDMEDAALAADLARNTRFVGEIGLDASPKHVPDGSLEKQVRAFELICEGCAESSGAAAPKVLSLHSVKAAEQTLDVLERTGCLNACRCVFHWFTGSNEALTRAVKAGCMFSVNEMMLRTRRGREYARQIPENRLLLETDLPPGRDIPFQAETIRDSLDRVLAELREIRGKDMDAIIQRNTENIFP